MAFSHGKHARIFVDEFNLSTYFSEVSAPRERDTAETSTFGGTAKTFVAGLANGTISASGFWDPVAGGSDVVLDAALGAATAKVVTISRESADAVGDRAELASAHETTYEASSSVDDANKVAAEFQADGGIDAGVILHAHEAETVDANEASVDNTAATTNGGVAHLHATAYSGLTNAIIKVQHSTDDVSFADLVTFTTLTAVGKQRVVVAAGTTVNRYLRATTDVTGTGSITYVCAFARR